jgi:replicative DNA helicase
MTTSPHSFEAERSVLSALLMSPAAAVVLGELRTDDFLDPLHRRVFEAIGDLAREQLPVDSTTVADRMGLFENVGNGARDLEALTEIAGFAPTWHRVEQYADIVIRHATQRRIAATCADYASRAQVQDADPGALLVDLRAALADLELRSPGGPGRIGSRLEGVLETIEGRLTRQDRAAFVGSGIAEYDAKIGPWKPGQLVVVAARPGMGKTALAGGCALKAAKRGEPALFFSLEMASQEVFERFVGAWTRTSVEAIGRGMGGQAMRKLFLDARDMADLPLWVDDRMLTIGQITATARSWRARNPSPRGLVVIDYLGLIRPTGRSESRALEVGRQAWGAKMLAKELACPVMLLAQLNRDAEKQDRDPMLSDLRDSGEIEQHADVVIFPQRRPPLHESGPAELQVAKNRGGRTGRIDCHWQAEVMTFDSQSQEVPSGYSYGYRDAAE